MIPEDTGGSLHESSIGENEQAEALIAADNLPEAAEILVKIVQDDPDNCRAYNNLGIISWSKKKWPDAFVMFRKAASLRPDYIDALVNLFDASLKLKKVHDTVPFFEKALAADPSLEELRIIRDSIVNLGDDIYFSNRALGIGTYSPRIEEAEKELEAGNLFKSMDLYLKANDEEGPSAAAYSGLGVISFYQQRYQDAYTLFIESIKLNPSDPETFLNLLDAAKEIGKVAEAGEIYTACRKEYPALESIAKEYEEIAAT